MTQYRKMNVHGTDVLFGFVDFLPIKSSDVHIALDKISELEKLPTDKQDPFHSVMQGANCVALLSNGMVYAPIAYVNDKSELDTLVDEVYTYMIRKGDYYEEHELKPNFNKTLNNHGITLHDQVMKDGFAMQASLLGGEMAVFNTVGLWHQDLPELAVVGAFKDSPDVIMHVLRLTVNYLEEHGAKEQVYEAGTIHDTHKVQLRSIDLDDEFNNDLLFTIRKYWNEDEHVEVMQLVLANKENELPPENSMCDHWDYQPLLTARKLHA